MRKRIIDAWRVLTGEYAAFPMPGPAPLWMPTQPTTTAGTNTTLTWKWTNAR